jgi:hypothetical protein
MAWRTELLLDLTAYALDDDELSRVANTWAVVQVYYVLYHSTQALGLAKGFARTPSHPKTQKLFKSFWADRRIQLPPWTLSWSHTGCANVPAGRYANDSIHAWAACDRDSCWSLAAKALRTTRKHSLADAHTSRRHLLQREKRAAWADQEAERVKAGKRARKAPSIPVPHLDNAEKAAVDQSVRACTVMDYLYRLRIRTNYEDAAMFVDGPTAQGESAAVRDDLRQLAAGCLLAHELALADIIGKAKVAGYISDFLHSTAPTTKVQPSLAARLQLLNQYGR